MGLLNDAVALAAGHRTTPDIAAVAVSDRTGAR